MKSIIFNPKYVLKPDEGRALIMASLVGRNLLVGVEDSFTNIIHPIHAMIICSVDGRSYEVCIEEAAVNLDVSKELVAKFIDKLIDNPNSVAFRDENGVSFFPPYSIISQYEQHIERRYEPELFAYNRIDLNQKRHLTPSTITLMVNNICITNCIYCYQDKSRLVNCKIPLERVKGLIKEAYELHVITFDVIGGEFFLYKHWKEVLYELRKFGYNPYLSTKMPLKESDIKYLASLNIYDIQISVDTFMDSHLKESIATDKGYAESMTNTLRLLDQYGISIMVHSVLTKYNSTIEDMQSIYNILKDIKHLTNWHVVKGDETLYPKTNYKDIEIDMIALKNIVDYLKVVSYEGIVSVVYPQGLLVAKTNETDDINDAREKFFNRSFCSGLYSSLYILPDGQVTMCEQLYWNKQFIIGSILDNSINEVWNSQKAKSLFYIEQSKIPSDSRCSICTDFKKCRDNRQVCYREVIKKNGSDKWYYPDVNCPYVLY